MGKFEDALLKKAEIDNTKDSNKLDNSSPFGKQYNDKPISSFESIISAKAKYGTPETQYVGAGGFGESSLDENIRPESAFNLERLRAEKQSGGEQLLGFLNQAVVGEIAGGTIEGTGYLIDIAENLGLQKDTEDEWGNFVSDFGKSIREWTQEATPIYQKQPGEFDMFDSGFWAANGVSVASTLSLMIPAAGALRGVSALGKLGMASKLGKAVKTAANLGKMGTQTAKWAGAGITQAVFSRHMENMMEGAGVFDEQYKKYLDEGLTDEKARAFAGEAASATYKADWLMLATDIPQYLAFGKILNPNKVAATGKAAAAANKAAGATIAGENMTLRAAKGLGGMLSEGMEESYQFIAAEEGKYIGDLMAGTTTERAFGDRMDDYIKDEEMWTSAFFGALGGGVFQLAAPAVQKGIAGLKGPSSAEEQANRKIQNIKEWAPKLREAQKRMNEADVTGNLKLIQEARTHSNLTRTMFALANNNAQTHLDFLEHMAGMSEEQLDAWNKENPGSELDAEFIKENLPKLIEDSKRITELHSKNINKYDQKEALQLTEQEFLAETFKKELIKAEDNLGTIEEKYSTLTKDLSTVGAQEMNHAVEIKSLREYKKQIQYLLDNDLLHPDTRKNIRDNLEAIEKSIEYQKEALKEVRKGERTSEEKAKDTKVFKSMSSVYDMSKQSAQIKFLEDAIALSVERADNIRNPNRKSTVNQEQAAKAELNSTVEDMLSDAGILEEFRKTGNTPEGSNVFLKGKEGKVSWNSTPILGERKDDKKDAKPGKKEDYKVTAGVGYIFTDSEGNITPIDLATVKNLYIEPKEVRDQRAFQKRRGIFLSRFKSLENVAKQLTTDLNEINARIEEGNEVLIENQAKLREHEQMLSDIIKDKSLDGRTKEVKALVASIEESIKELEDLVAEYNNMRSDLTNRKKVIEGELKFVEEELPRIINDHNEEIATAKLTKEQFIEANEDIRKYESLFSSPESLRETIVQTDTAIGQLDDLVNSLQEQVDYLRKVSRPPIKTDLKLQNNEREEWYEDTKLLRRRLVEARKNLRHAIERRDNYIEMYNSYTEAQNISSLYPRLKGDYVKRRNVARKLTNEAQKPEEAGQVAPVDVIATFEAADAVIRKAEEDSFRARKSSLNTTGGRHIEDNKVTTREMQARWFSALSKLPKITDENGYHLKVVTLDETLKDTPSYMSEAFDTEDEQFNKQGDLKVVLVDKEGKLVKADKDGNLNENGEILANYLHRSDRFIEELDKDSVVDQYIKEKLKDPNGVKAFKGNVINHGNTQYNKEEVYEVAKKWMSEAHDKLREDALADMVAGESVYLEVVSRSSGIPRTLPRKDGKQDRKKATQYFAPMHEIAKIHVPHTQNLTLSTNEMEEHKVFPGIPYIEDNNGNLVQGITRKLNDKEVEIIVDLLHHATNGKGDENFTVKNKDEKWKSTIDIFSRGEGRYGLIPSLIYYGKAKEESNKKHQVYFSNQTLYFGENQSVPVQQINTSTEFKTWLEDKHVQISKKQLEKEKFIEPTGFDPKTGLIETRTWSPKHGLNGYSVYLLEKDVIGTDILPRSKVQFASTYLNFKPTIKNSTATKTTSTVAPTVVPTIAPTATPTATPVDEVTEIKEWEDLDKVPEGATVIINRKAKRNFKLADVAITTTKKGKGLEVVSAFDKTNDQQLPKLDNTKDLVNKFMSTRGEALLDQVIEGTQQEGAWRIQSITVGVEAAPTAPTAVPVATVAPQDAGPVRNLSPTMQKLMAAKIAANKKNADKDSDKVCGLKK